jgi:anti-anti-sigma regulatory factor
MVVTYQTAANCLVLAAQGEISVFSVEEFNSGVAAALSTSQARNLILDLSGVSLVDFARPTIESRGAATD